MMMNKKMKMIYRYQQSEVDSDEPKKKIQNCIYQHLWRSSLQHRISIKQSLTGLNSEFSFVKTSCNTKVEE